MVSIGALVVVGLTAPGCVTPPDDLPGIVRGEELEDFPYPSDFDLVESSRYPFPEGVEGRSWRATYHGPYSGALDAWFVKNMPASGWIYRGRRTLPSGEKLLRFEKNDEEATIQLSKGIDYKRAGPMSVVKASVSPRGLETYVTDDRPSNTTRADTIEPASYEKAGNR